MAPTIMNCLWNKTHQTHAPSSINQINFSLHLQENNIGKWKKKKKTINTCHNKQTLFKKINIKIITKEPTHK